MRASFVIVLLPDMDTQKSLMGINWGKLLKHWIEAGRPVPTVSDQTDSGDRQSAHGHNLSTLSGVPANPLLAADIP